MLVANILAVVVISLAFISFLGGILGWWGTPIHFSDKVDLFYVEPRTLDTRRKRHNRQRAIQTNAVVVRRPSQGRVVLGRKTKPARVNEKLHTDSQPVRRDMGQHPVVVDTGVFRDCVDTLVALGFKSGDAKREVQRFTQSHQITTVQDFLDDYYKKKT